MGISTLLLRTKTSDENAKAKLYRDYNTFNVTLSKKDLDKNLKSNNTIKGTVMQIEKALTSDRLRVSKVF